MNLLQRKFLSSYAPHLGSFAYAVFLQGQEADEGDQDEAEHGASPEVVESDQESNQVRNCFFPQ